MRRGEALLFDEDQGMNFVDEREAADGARFRNLPAASIAVAEKDQHALILDLLAVGIEILHPIQSQPATNG